MRFLIFLLFLALTLAYTQASEKTFSVILRERPAKILDTFQTRAFLTQPHHQRANSVAQALQNHAATTQADLWNFLSTHQKTLGQSQASPVYTIESLWITNEIQLTNPPPALLAQLKRRDDVLSVHEVKPLPVDHFIDYTVPLNGTRVGQDQVQWGVAKIDAPAVWESGNKGEGIIVTIIDSGVNGQHDTLKDTYIGNDNFGWFDPDGKTTDPWDGHGHGTHCAGIVAGSNNVGVAPGAKWSACRTMNAKNEMTKITQCAQWALCPSGDAGDCKAPHIVSNSWGAPGGNTGHDPIVNAWRAAGLIPVFSNGNRGPLCSTLSSPGDNPKVIAVANVDKNDEPFVQTPPGSSSNGPGTRKDATQKPDIAAPGTSIMSAAHNDNTKLVSKTGSSMAAPHAAGAIALLMNANGGQLTVEQARSALQNGAEHTKASRKLKEQECGGRTADQFPNFYVGQGRINVKNSIEWLKNNSMDM